MKKIILGIGMLAAFHSAKAINGLENIIVEKYYVSNAADAAGSAGTLPVGSVTYRIYVDMLPGFKFQALYGVPTHQLRVQTTTTFFNNEDRGDITPTYTKTQAGLNTVMLDSWLSVGGACAGQFGVLKSEDNGVANVVNTNGLLQNADPAEGIPLTSQDGLIAGSPETITFVGFDPPIDPTNTDPEIFNATSSVGGLFSVYNGSIASLNGSVGPTATNRVLIAQITTDGELSFELNVQIGTPAGGIQQYVARNPVGNEIQFPGLIYSKVDLTLKAFLQGFYIGGGMMNAVVDPVTFPNVSDSIILELHEAVAPYNLKFQIKNVLGTNGQGHFIFPVDAINQSYYLAIHQRNSIETWSKNPVFLTDATSYDFTSSADKAFGDNQIPVFDSNGFSIFSGDINQDGAVDGSDFLELDPSIQNGDGGYMVGDLNGDGAVDGSDFLTLDPNVQLGVGAAIPF